MPPDPMHNRALELELAPTGEHNARAPALATRLESMATHALFDELALYPKPGLVSLRDAGAHRDMDASTFIRSLFSLRRYFFAIAIAGAHGARFAELCRLGVRAEARMLEATGGINTHRGAIFALGLLVASAARVLVQKLRPADDTLRETLEALYGKDLRAGSDAAITSSHGAIVASRHGAGGARFEAAAGFPSVFEIALPELRACLARFGDVRRARIAALFALLEHVADTNVLYRGGRTGLRFMQSSAREYRRSGGVANDRDFARARCLHAAFVERGLSAGGCADLLAAALFVHSLQRRP